MGHKPKKQPPVGVGRGLPENPDGDCSHVWTYLTLYVDTCIVVNMDANLSASGNIGPVTGKVRREQWRRSQNKRRARVRDVKQRMLRLAAAAQYAREEGRNGVKGITFGWEFTPEAWAEFEALAKSINADPEKMLVDAAANMAREIARTQRARAKQ